MVTKSAKKYTRLISDLIEANEAQNKENGLNIHGDIGVLNSLVIMEISKQHEKNNIPDESYNHLIELLDELSARLRALSTKLNPKTLSLGLLKMLVSYNRETEMSRAVKITLEDRVNTVLPFEYKDQLKIFRVYDYVLNYFFDSLNCDKIKITVFNNSKFLILEFTNTSFEISKTRNLGAANKNLKVIEAFLVALKTKFDKESDFINRIKINIPFKPTSSLIHKVLLSVFKNGSATFNHSCIMSPCRKTGLLQS